MAGSNRVTIEEIGARLNISTSTVSRALRQDTLIHPETRARVNAMAIDLGYQGRSRQGPNRGKTKQSIAVLFSVTSLAHVRHGHITANYLQGLTSEAENIGIALNLHTVASHDSPDFEESGGVPNSLLSGERDIVIVTGHHHSETIRKLTTKVSLISLVWDYPEVPHDLVTTADAAGMNMIVEELAKLGHRKLCWIGSAFQGSFVEGRMSGFIYGCIQNNLQLTEQFFFGRDLFENYKIVKPERVIEAYRKGCTAFVCASDHTADLTLEVLNGAGIKVPKDVSLTGFDNSNERQQDGKSLITSVNPHFVEMGRTAVRLAKWRLEQPSAFPMTLSLRPRFVEGASTGPVRKRK